MDNDIHKLREAIRLTREYVGPQLLPAVPGWSWYDAIAATGGFEGFGECGCVLDPAIHGRNPNSTLLFCNLDINHSEDHGRKRVYHESNDPSGKRPW